MAFAESSNPTLDDKPTLPAPSGPEWQHGDTTLDRPSNGAGRSSPLISPEALHRGIPQPKREGGSEPHHPTPPIAVPYHEDKSHGPAEAEIEYPHSPRLAELSPLEQFARNRRPSISFNPEVRLDTGVYQSIDVPLRNSYERRKVDAKSSLTCSTSQLQALYARASLEDHRDQPWQEDASRGKRDDASQTVARETGDVRNFVASPVSDGPPDLQRPTSLTSLSTASPLTEEIVTPPDARRGQYSSSDGTLPAVVRTGSLGDADSWPNYGRYNQSPQARSNSVRKLRRPESRRSTISGGKSPASAFLSMWNIHDSAPEPDDEGQMVGADYVLGKQIGFGGFSVVKEAFKVKEHGETERFAVKIVRKHFAGKSERENDQVQAEFDHEVRLWRYMNHPHILPLDAVYVTDAATFCFTRMTTGGTLFDLVRRRRGGLKLNQARKYAYQLAQAIKYLHEDARVVHRDIKLENCLLDPAPDIVTKEDDVSQLILCDFGMAEWMTTEAGGGSPDPYDNAADRPPPKNIGPSDTSTSRAGSLEYASPELLSSDHGVLDPVVDIWAFGVVTFTLVVGARPFQHTFQPRVQMNILAGHWDKNAVLNGDGDLEDRQDALELIQGCLEMDPVKRWTISEVMSARWLECLADATKDEVPARWSS